VGALRAAQYIAHHPNEPTGEEVFSDILSAAEQKVPGDASARIQKARRRMSDCAGAVRDPDKLREALQATLLELQTAEDPKLLDVLLTQGAVLTAMAQPACDPGWVQEVVFTGQGFEATLRPVRPIPREDSFFENVWRGYRENQNVF